MTLFWRVVAGQNAAALKTYFAPTVYIRWNNANEPEERTELYHNED